MLTAESRRIAARHQLRKLPAPVSFSPGGGCAVIPAMHCVFDPPRSRHHLGWFLFLILLLPAPAAVSPEERILILVSLDGFRTDYPHKHKSPNLSRLATEGVRAEKLIPCFPSMTFPNHQTIVTGWRPARHGIIHNNFSDPRTKQTFAFNKAELQGPEWWGGEPIWATAIKQGRRANVLYWPGTGTKMADLLPTEWKSYEAKPTPNEIVDHGLTWLEQPKEKRPNLVMLYFHHVDSAGHKYGPTSPEVAASVAEVDAALGRLVEGLRRLRLEAVANLVIVSDHGMTDISTERMIFLGDIVKPETVQVEFSGAVAGLRPLDGNVDALYEQFKRNENHFRTYREETMPNEYHFRKNPRIPPVMLVAEDGWYLSNRPVAEQKARAFNKATHGYDPQCDSMGATFVAWGPAFRQKTTIKPVENVHLYNFFCATLGLKPSPNDGDDEIVRAVLAR